MRDLLHDPSRSGSASAVLSLATVVGLGVGTALAMRGTWRRPGRSPLELLDDLERRHRGRRQLMLIVNVYAAANLAGGIGLAILRQSEPPVDGHGVARFLVSSALSAVALVVVNQRVRRRIDRELAEARQARQLLQEPLPD